VEILLRCFAASRALVDTMRGMILNNVHFKIVLDAVICGAPARSYVKRTQFHTGKYACEKCNVIGISMGGMSFHPIWVRGKKRDLRNKLTDEKLELMNSRILKCIKLFPNDFVRRRREIEEVSRWKAVEYRSFLLYSGPVVIKDILTEEKYLHFILLYAAMRILLSPSSRMPQFKYAGNCLLEFVKFIPSLYGEHNVRLN